ncbi:DUF2523 domain-containing protein [Chitinilyticum litopenaei]|uniref:DUF2523 domain-containing protein n=1 Tax=Chitinilyticum litopenaei TaxID=1121276 RepID=UPI0006843881|nr:DUF2523 domain-containing protein [Chitinilyticum litopenaei]
MAAPILIPFLVAIATKIATITGWILVALTAIFVCLWLLGTDLGKWLFEQILQLVVYILNNLDIDLTFLNPSEYIPIPAEIQNVLGALGIDTSLGIILAAILVKLLLQLIPFTRLGS